MRFIVKEAEEILEFINKQHNEISRQFGVKKLDYLEVRQKTMQVPEVIWIFMYHFPGKASGILQLFIPALKVL